MPTRPPAVQLMRKMGLEPDPWQVEVLAGDYSRLLLNCCRQAGKSTAVAMLGLAEALYEPGTKVLLLSRSHRQSRELFRIVIGFYEKLKRPLAKRQTAEELHLEHQSEIVCLPCKEETIRGYSGVGLLIIDEAARVPDDLYRAVSPMLAVSGGRMIALSTPYGKRGFFWEAWARGKEDWHRIEVAADRVARIKPDFLDRERRTLGESWFRQEYCCSFEALEGLVYPEFARCVVASLPAFPDLGGRREIREGEEEREREGRKIRGQRVGGIDFGLRNPFAAVWGTLDRDDVLWLAGEHFCREQSLAYHARHLPRDVTWYADPAGAREILELRLAGLVVRTGDNERRPGIAAVRARVEDGTLKVLAGACPNLVAEAGLYRYDTDRAGRSEDPINDHNHALDALRYLISRIDARRLARIRGAAPETEPGVVLPGAAPEQPPRPPKRKWLSVYNEFLWHPLR